MGRLLILADDFTGACDAAAAFAASCGTLIVHGLPAQWPSDAEEVAVLGVDLDLRERSNPDAQALSYATARQLCDDQPHPRVFLKIDSTLRGPIAGLVTGALMGSARPIAVIAPAFPEQGRLLRDGRLVVDGRPGASLTEALGMEHTALLGANFVRSAEEVELAVEHARTRGARHVVVDTDGVDCLHSVATAWRRHAHEWLLVGSAGLARQVAGVVDHPVSGLSPTVGAVLVVAGSPAPATRVQLEQLRDLGPLVVVNIEAPVPSRPSGTTLVVLSTSPLNERDLSERDPGERDPGERDPGERDSGERDSGERARAVAAVVAAWAAEFRPGALVLAGGATARLVCERLGVRGVRLQGELQPGIPFGSLVDGLWHGIPVVTKAGGFGGASTLLDVVHALGVSSIAERTHD